MPGFFLVYVCRALRGRKKTGGENNPVGIIGDILAAELSHMQPYIRFCSCQFNGATLLQTRTDSDSDFKDFMRVGGIPTSCPLPMRASCFPFIVWEF